MRDKYDLLIFDWDGTLMNSIDQIVECIEAAASDAGAPTLPPSTLKNIIGLGLREAMDTLYPDQSEAVIGKLVERYRYHFVEQKRGNAELFPGVEQMLAKLLDSGYQLAVATGKARVGLKRVFNETGYDRYFHASRCADETESKPHPKMVFELMQELQAEPGRTLVIGDTLYDMHMARNAGVDGLAVTYGVHACTQLREHEPIACVDTVGELQAWLDTPRKSIDSM